MNSLEQFDWLLEQYEKGLIYLEHPPRGFPLEELILRSRLNPVPWYFCVIWVRLQWQSSSAINLIEPSQVLELFLLRDEIQTLLEKSPSILRKILPQIQGLDERLREQDLAIAETCPLKNWQALRNPPESFWWWFFEIPEGIHPWERFDWLWSILTIPVLAFNFSLVVNVSSRFISGGIDPFGAFAVVSQGMLATLTAGGTFTKKGRQNIEKFLTSLNVPKHFWQEAQLGGSLVVMFMLLGLQSSLPNIAKSYIERGNRNLQEDLLESALANYRRADKLDPDGEKLRDNLDRISQKYLERGKKAYRGQHPYPEPEPIDALENFEQAVNLASTNMEAHFYLGLIYEDLLEFDQSRQQYRLAMLGHYPPAFLNLARLYLLQGEDPEIVVTFLNQAKPEIDRVESEEEREILEYFLLKNRGWARLKQARYAEAETDLREALEKASKIELNQASPFCLLAQVLEAKGQLREAITFWERCIQYADRDLAEEDRWLDLAKQRLNVAKEKGIYQDNN